MTSQVRHILGVVQVAFTQVCVCAGVGMGGCTGIIFSPPWEVFELEELVSEFSQPPFTLHEEKDGTTSAKTSKKEAKNFFTFPFFTVFVSIIKFLSCNEAVLLVNA